MPSVEVLLFNHCMHVFSSASGSLVACCTVFHPHHDAWRTCPSSMPLKKLFICIEGVELSAPPAPPISKRSIIEGIDAFISEAMEGYHAETWRACFCAHVLLHLPRFSFETEGTKQALAIVFCKASFSHSLDIRSKPVALRKPFLLVIAARYIYCPGYIKKVLEKDEDEGLTGWVSLWSQENLNFSIFFSLMDVLVLKNLISCCIV
ncbi:uncharacterized protein LOC105421705 isoform X2 [Amborella trichopoda]|uniref:uncharacterized protein LOC105421705 isoform X2 n=1 Tax=Amborella trichopoda TaxID=13333 RepID=UPI0009BEE4F5|nr:uncharacterized protein LOC105421705 isoform X2 [Amborella trichopoda]|eukprot:XP_020531452.1 uncharacterized protein LOC105421705 isoform X2 [Amborella trichopoda]